MTEVTMRKVTKILLKALSVTLLFLIFCPIVLTLLIDLPSVQNFLVDKATQYLSQKTETKVEIDRIRLGALGSLRVEGLYVEDYQQDTLLYIGKLKIYLSRFEGAKGITLRNGSVERGKLYIHETPEGVMNIKQVVNRMVKRREDKPKSEFALKISDVQIDDFTLVIEQREHRDPSYGIDYRDMHLENMSAFVDDFTLIGGRVGGFIRNFTTREHSGFTIDNFTGHFLVDKGVVDLRDFNITAAESDIRLSSLVLEGENWAAYKDFIHNVTIRGEVVDSYVSTNDIAHFAPAMLPWELEAHNANIAVNGTVADLRVNVKNLDFGQNSNLRGNVRLRGLPNVRRATMSLDLSRLLTNQTDASMVLEGITGRKILPEKVLSMVDAAGEIICSGKFNGGFQSFESDLLLTTEAGNLALTASREPVKRDAEDKSVANRLPASTLIATVDARHVNLGSILHNNLFGNATAYVSFFGTTTAKSISGRVAGRVGAIGLNDCTYENIDVEGRLVNKSFSGSVRSDCDALRMVMTGMADLNSDNPTYDFHMTVNDADLHAMNLNERDSVSLLGFDVDLYAVGRNIDDMNGSISIESGHYYYNADTLRTGAINLSARSRENQRSLTLTSDFADATFTGPSSYKDVVKYLQTAMRKYLPGLADEDSVVAVAEDKGYSALSVRVKNIDPLLDAISDGLQLAEGSVLNFTMNPVTNHIALRAASDYLERGNMLATNLNMNLTNQGDSLAMYLQAEDFYVSTFHLPQLSVMGGAKNDRVLLTSGFRDTIGDLSGVVSVFANIQQDPLTLRRSVNLGLLPATITSRGRDWNLLSGRIKIDTARIEVERFSVKSGEQEMLLAGVMSRQSEDSLTLKLKDFSIAPFMGFANRMGYTVTGKGNGEAYIKAALDGGEFTSDIDIDSMKVNQTPVAPLRLDSRWDFGQQRARIRVINRTTGDSIVRGYYAPKSNRYYAEGRFEKLPMAMLDPILSGVVSETQGMADAELEIMGKGRQASLNGSVDVKDLSTMIDYTRVRYSVPRAKIQVKDNHFIATNVRAYDKEKNSGLLTMDLSLEHLSNISYNLRIVPRNMLVLNTTLQDNDLFYGKVYASGVATVRGSKKGTTLDIVGSTEGNSQFFMPLSGKSDASNADFVVFERAGMRPDSTRNHQLLRKKMAFERRNRRADSSDSNMDINIELTARPNAEVQLVIDPTVGDIIKGRGNGTFNIRIVPSANIFDMYGDYTITEGSYLFTLQNIINKRFIIENGSTIQWTGDPLDARLNIDAVYKLKASLQPLLSSTTLDNVTRAVPVECVINLTERLTNPTVLFDIKVPNADSEIQNAVANLLNNQQSIATQFMYLLVSGSFYSDSSTSSNIGASASATTGFELLSNQLSNWLSSDDYNIILRYRPRSELTSDEIDFGFSKSLANNRLLLELEGNYLVDTRMAASSNMSNFMGEAYITWLIDQAGNLKLRGFTQTIDRFDENQGLQETGVGIYYREDFNNWADLKRRIKERFMSRRKREERDSLRREQEMRVEESADSLNRYGENMIILETQDSTTMTNNKQ